MARTICYEEFCGVDDKIHLKTLIVFALAAAVIIASAIVAFTVFEGIEMMRFPFSLEEL